MMDSPLRSLVGSVVNGQSSTAYSEVGNPAGPLASTLKDLTYL